MSVPIRVRLYKDGMRVAHPERYRTLSYTLGVDPVVDRAGFGRCVVEEVVRDLPASLDFNEIEIDYYGFTITGNRHNTLVKVVSQ